MNRPTPRPCAVLLKDIGAIGRIEAHAASLPMETLTRAQLESLGFALHNIYNALENSFSQISLTFENHVKERERWHRELLEKMFLAVPPLRPAVLPQSVRDLLGDLLGFRHLFRHSYEFALDRAKTLTLWQRWRDLGMETGHALRAFAQQLERIAGAQGAGSDR